MGKSFTFRCKECGHNLKFYFGTGAMYPEKYQEIINDALTGKLGSQIQKFLIENPAGATDISRVLANCENFGHHEMVRDLTMYLPQENFSQDKSYPLTWELREHYKVLEKYQHKCSYCGEPVQVVTAENFFDQKIILRCPNCETEMLPRKSAPKHWD